MSPVPAASLTWLRPEVADLQKRLDTFVQEECIPAEAELEAHLHNRHGEDRWRMQAIPPVMKQLQQRAKDLGFWNMFLPKHLLSAVQRLDPSLLPSICLSFREYGILCETLGRSPYLAPQACNCSAPDTGNMEVLLEFGTLEQQQTYALPLLRGEIRSAFLMTEPAVASSDATNLQTKLMNFDAHHFQISGRKWWSTGAMDPRCQIFLVVTKTENPKSRHESHTIVLVPKATKGVVLERALTVFGYDDAPSGHAQVLLDNIIVPKTNVILGEGTGFTVSQARLGPGRIHHCMRAIGMAARAYELMLSRSIERKTFGKRLYEHGMAQQTVADSFSDLQMARLLTLNCAASLDEVGARKARASIASLKVTVPQLCYTIVDRAVQLHGGLGVCGETFLAQALAGLRTLRIADGPDDVHRRTVARVEIQRLKNTLAATHRSRL